MKRLLVVITIALLLLVMPLSVGYAAPATVQDQLLPPVATQSETFGGIAYVQYDGIFEGQTSTGEFRVPYRITVLEDLGFGNRTVIVEPSHYVAGLATLDSALGRDFLLSRGFAHAGIGWSTTKLGSSHLRILDPNMPNVYIKGGFSDGNGRTDDEIISDFARALMIDPVAKQILGRVDRRYLTGFSDTSDPVLRLVTSGRANRVFDLVFPYTATTTGPNDPWDGPNPQTALTDGRYTGKLMITNSEAEGASVPLVDGGLTPRQYRFYAVAGTPHIPASFWFATTPAIFQPELRAHFLQGHNWVMGAKQPPLSTHLATSTDGTLLRDTSGNAISVNAKGNPMPRLPFIELGEAHFTTGIDPFDPFGSYEAVKEIADLGFVSHDAYLKEFEEKLVNYSKAGYILKEDADAMLSRAALCPTKTFTEVYRDAYDNFVTITPCSP